ncbi:MAG TPA: cytochrome c [Candidatus Acidoferrum sp.]|nr:cytochrome c [Candidatus Acidoferrum sp.]
MKFRAPILALVLAAVAGFTAIAIAQGRKNSDRAGIAAPEPAQQSAAATDPSNSKPSSAASPGDTSHQASSSQHLDARWMRIEGEKRYRTNCGRCHVAPQKFPPRAMATIVRHMRVRAMLTDEDMRLILRYMTE